MSSGTKSANKYPGLKLRQVLRAGQQNHITRIAWSPDGTTLAVPTQLDELELWDIASSLLKGRIEVRGGGKWITTASWSPDGLYLAVGAGDGFTRLWTTEHYARVSLPNRRTLVFEGNLAGWSPDGKVLATAGQRNVTFYTANGWSKIQSALLDAPILAISWSDTGALAVGRRNGLMLLTPSGSIEQQFPNRNSEPVHSLAWSPDHHILATGMRYGQIALWHFPAQEPRVVLEGHTRPVRSLSFSADGRLLASKSDDETVRVWDVLKATLLAVVEEPVFERLNITRGNKRPAGLAFHPIDPVLATLGDSDRSVRVWDLDLSVLLESVPDDAAVRYTTAKIVLVGDSGVGKTGLGWRLSHNVFKEHSSTHGQQFWVLEHLRAKRSDQTECEAVLWDLAGQSDYRLTHALFLDKVDLALILFDPGNQSARGCTNRPRSHGPNRERDRRILPEPWNYRRLCGHQRHDWPRPR
jgi:WD40 repeat protein